MAWKSISGFEGLYAVSDEGFVKNVKRGTILSSRKNGDGYSRVALSKDGNYSHKLVHRLVAHEFCPNPYDKPLVRHKNGDPGDNRAENLLWGDNSENMLDKGLHGTDWHRNKTHCKYGHEFSEENTYRNKRGHRSCQKCRRAYTAASNAKRKSNRIGGM